MKTLDRLKMLIEMNGGFVNAHAHFDRAYTAQTSDFEKNNVNAHLFEKWELVNDYKKSATIERYYNHISEAIYNQIKMGVTAVDGCRHQTVFKGQECAIGTFRVAVGIPGTCHRPDACDLPTTQQS